MKKIKFLWLLFALCNSSITRAQEKTAADTSVQFKVFGACGMCKDRIEEAVRVKGVKSASWDIETKQLSLVYSPGIVSLEKIGNHIVAVGHDLENRKAKELVYSELPECCHYRKMEAMLGDHSTDTAVFQGTVAATEGGQVSHIIKGIVVEDDNKGKFNPLPNASVQWLGFNTIVLTDSTGLFEIKHEGKSSRLVVSYTGYQPDTISVVDMKDLKIVLASRRQLKEVVVNSSLRSSYISNLSPIRTQTMTANELLKAACCNLSESFETNPSVDVSYNDAVTGSKQIQLLGLSGNYTQLTVENLPGPRGIATPLGLNSIAGPWIESIQLTKGTGSVANGFESIAGQINVELKKPELAEQLYANVYVNDFGKTDLNLNLNKKIGKKWSAGLLVHDDFIYNNTVDFNKDGFRDVPTGNQFSMVNRYKFDNSKGLLAQFGFKILNDNKTGGEVDYDPDVDKNTTNHYGLGIKSERYEAFGKIGYIFPQKKYKSLGLQLAAISHKQDSYFGLTTYNARQKSFYANFIYQSIINSTIHKFRTGISFAYDNYDELFKLDSYQRTETVPGVFGEYTYTPGEKFSAVAGLRADHSNLFGFFITPRINLRYEPVKGTTIRASAGRGQRTANIFAENMSVFVSARQVSIISDETGKAYGLNPEVAWNKGISIDQKFRLFQNDANAGIDFFRNDFTKQVVVDLEDARQVNFYNLDGRSYSNSFQTEFSFAPVKKFDVRLAYRFFDVKTDYNSKLLQRPLIAKHRAFTNFAYTVGGFKFDYTITYNGSKRIPNTSVNPPQYQAQQTSPGYVLMHAQVSKTFGKKHPMDFYIGAENITNFYQQNVIIASDDPFGRYFDASLVWGPVIGRMLYAGWRFKIK